MQEVLKRVNNRSNSKVSLLHRETRILKLTNIKAQSQPHPSAKSEYRPSSSHQYGPSPPVSTRGTLPPTPPMQSEPGFDGRQSPSSMSNSSHSVVSATGYYYPPPVSAINNVEPYSQRQHVPGPARRVSMPATMAYQQSPYSNSSQYSPSQQSMSSYYSSPMQQTPPQSQISGLYYQRPLPQVRIPSSLSLSKP